MTSQRSIFACLLTAFCLAASPVWADGSLGVFFDHTGEGAVQIEPCDGKLCGRVVWIREDMPMTACGLAVIGNVAKVGEGVWDGGWILDPEFGGKFDVEITRLNDEEIQVVGYLGTKTLSETFVWKRAPANLQRCIPSGEIAAAQ